MGKKRALRWLLRSLLLSVLAVEDASAVNIGPGFTGAWYDPAQSGHGLFLEVLNNNGFLAWWFTFDPTGTKQSWFGGVGTYSGNTATITQVIQTTGGRWIPNFDPSKLVQVPWGTLAFTFTDCNNGRVDFNSSVPGYGAGSMTLSRLTLPDGLTCSDSPVGPGSAAGIWTGTTTANEGALAIVLEDGTYYIDYATAGTTKDAGVFAGTATTAGGAFSSSDAIDYPIAQGIETGGFASAASVGGSYVGKGTLQLSLTGHGSARSLSATYVSGSDQPPSLAALAGSYGGWTGHAGGRRSASVSLDSAGNFGGSNDAGCLLSGTVTPRAAVDAFDWTLTGTVNCIFGLGPIHGVLYYDTAAKKIYGFAPYAGRIDQYFLIATKQ